MAQSRATTRTWLIVAIAAAAVLIAATTAAAVITLDHHDDPTRAGPMSGVDNGSRGDERTTPWAWMHDGRLQDEADYLSRMVAHHREAVAAAEDLRRSDRSQMRAFGAGIVKTQSAQIDQMSAWLERWYPDQPADTGYRPMMRNLSDLSGDALDRAFLRDMTIHHMAAVMMSQQLLARGLAIHPEVARLARSIRDQQHVEIFRMQRWLHDWFGESWHGGYGGMTGPGDRWMMGGRNRHQSGMGPWMMR